MATVNDHAPNALEVRNLSKTYGDFTLKNVGFTLPTGAIMGFVGQNGAGKTTTIRCILNMAKRDSGEVAVFGRELTPDDLDLKQEIGAVFDEIFFLGRWKVGQVESAIRGFYPTWDSGLFHDFLSEFEIAPTKRVGDLSRGMKMKLMLAVAMSHNAKLLILDEPTSGLDPVARDELLDILQMYINDGDKSVFFSTHITSDLERAAGYITLIDQGRIFYTGAKDGLLDHFVTIKGVREDLTPQLRSETIGLSWVQGGFEAMVAASASTGLPATITVAHPDIDEILVHIAKQGEHNA